MSNEENTQATLQTPVKKEKHVKNVNIKQCFLTILGVIFGCVALVLPATFGNEFTFLFMHMPIINNIESFDLTSTTNILFGLQALFGLETSLLETLGLIYSYAPLIYFGILGLDFVMALFLIITRSQIFRVIFKLFSIVFAFAMLAFALLYLAYIVGFAGLFIHSLIKIENLLSSLDKSGILVALGFVILGFTFMKKQFKWFAKLY